MQEDVNFALAALNRLLFDLNITISGLHISKMGANGKYMVNWKTRMGDYQVPIVYKMNMKSTFRLHNIPMGRSATISDFADTMLFSVIYNMINNKDLQPVEFFFQALCAYWDQIFIDTMHDYYFRINDSIKILKNMVYKSSMSETEPYTHINNPLFFIFFVTSPSGNRLYYAGRLHERSEIKNARKGLIW
jgi:hypothetical protein